MSKNSAEPLLAPSRPAGRRPGPGRALAATYTLFALAAGSRAAVELIVQPGRAPVAYGLSVLSAACYLIGALAFRQQTTLARRIALVACAFELLAVLIIGSLTLQHPARWGDETVWSAYGYGYGFIPVLLPVMGLIYLRRVAPRKMGL